MRSWHIAPVKNKGTIKTHLRYKGYTTFPVLMQMLTDVRKKTFIESEAHKRERVNACV